MRCIFCKVVSTGSRSVEHILPEALGNHTQILPCGVVCDKCNNYFSREVERPFLDLDAIRMMRHHQVLASKKGSVPPLAGFIEPDVEIISRRHIKGPYTATIDVPPEAFQRILNGDVNHLILPVSAPLPQSQSVSRFVAKVAVEAFAQRLVGNEEALRRMIDDPQLDAVRDHARRGSIKQWPVHIRRIYDPEQKFIDTSGTACQVVHESDFLVTEQNEYYFVLALFGMEFTLNIGGPDIDGYLAWLEQHDNGSPLHMGKNVGLLTPVPRGAG